MNNDEPLDGDIGPAAPAETAPAAETAAPVEAAATKAAVAEELRRYEAEREARRRRTNAIAGRVALWAAALLLAFLAFDSVRTALEARRKGDPWLYPPAVNAAICLFALLLIAGWALRRRTRR
ncbi:hypothetical protein [Actinomadura macrotermitis]|uniref:Uncharacterized protein n=1 Tax=Actinomadura macrotermitis TaxID=2585200 RepID=A0A7K0BUB7_9ACTN|nr:hypothetical protein [Actinomadura macrotermitis]MQY04284.1 hypothetical protein [Actinomadura macrotermitis]